MNHKFHPAVYYIQTEQHQLCPEGYLILAQKSLQECIGPETFINLPPYARIYHQSIPPGSVLSDLGGIPADALALSNFGSRGLSIHLV